MDDSNNNTNTTIISGLNEFWKELKTYLYNIEAFQYMDNRAAEYKHRYLHVTNYLLLYSLAIMPMYTMFLSWSFGLYV